MHLAYVLAEHIDLATGPGRKITAQVASWEAAGHRVSLVALPGPTGGVALLREFNRACGSIRDINPDAVYYRHHVFVPRLLQVLRRWPVVAEINSDDRVEARGRRWPFNPYHRATRWITFRGAAGVVYPTYELAARLQPRRGRHPSYVVANGVDLAAAPIYPPPRNTRPRLAFTFSSTGPWPGLDLVFDAASRLGEFDFDIIGPVPAGYEAPANCRLHGVLEGPSYHQVLAKADVGIASVAMHRIGLREGSTLKLRGYLASGIPAILGYDDTDFPGDVPFLLRVPGTDDGLRNNLDAIRRFVRAMIGRRVARDEIAHIDIAVKESERLAFIADVRARR